MENRIVARYVGGNPNGSMRDIAAIRNEAGNVVGIMPHPEHAIAALTGPSVDGLGFFTSITQGDRRRSYEPPGGGTGMTIADHETPDATSGAGFTPAESGEPTGSPRYANVSGALPVPPTRPASAPTSASGASGAGASATHPERVQEEGFDVLPFNGVDSVERAATTPSEAQPYRELGLADDEYAKVRSILGRRPTDSELYMYSIMWSEHCSYKSSKVHLRQFGDKAPHSDRLLAGMGENAGVIAISDRLAVTFKVESHNHPSFVEPYQGAATGVGGIVRDILAMGARPIAVMDPLRFGAIDHPDTARVLGGIVGGVGGYGNCLGLPNIGGELVFDPCYQANPLLNALCLGVLPTDGLQSKNATGPGNVVVLMGAKTGRDGIGGASVLASATFDADSETRRPSVQVGDPFTEKLLIEACLELYAAKLVVGIQDLGAAGISCALTETAAGAGTGMRAYLERVPLREPSMAPHEILASESQERMLLIVTPENLKAVFAVAEKWGVLATDIGEVTDTGRLVITWHGETVVDVPPGSLADDGPVYARPMREPADRPLLMVDRAETLPRPKSGEELLATVLRMIGSPNLCDKTYVTEQYDRYVLGNTVLAQPEDAGVIRLDEETGLGVALSDRRQRPVHSPRSVRRRAARVGRGVPERGDDRSRAGRGHELPQLRLARGSGGDVAVRRGGTRPRRRLRDHRDSGHRRQRELLQPDRCGGDQPDPGRGRARHPRERRRARTRWVSKTTATCCISWATRTRSCPARSGRGLSMGISADSRRGSTSRPSARWR